MKLGEKIKYLRKSKGISQEELATMLKINRNFLSRIETGKSDPNAGILKSIAQIFNVDLNSLLDINNSEEQGIDKIKYITENKNFDLIESLAENISQVVLDKFNLVN